MSQQLLFIVLGLGLGAVYAALSLGIVVTYQGTGVINFAAAAMATVPLYVYSDLRQGVFTLPLPWFPTFDIPELPTWLCIVLGLIVAAILGALVQVLVSRPLRHAPVLAKVVAAVGVMLTLQAGVALKYGTEARPLEPILPTGNVEVFGAPLPKDRLLLIAITIVVGAALAVWFRRSLTGLAIQAASENERAALFARLSPTRLGMITWVLSAVLTAFILLMAGPGVGVLTPQNLTLLVVPALAAALIARLRSLWAALAGALALGVVQSELQFLSSTKSWWPDWAKQGLLDAVPFIVIVIALFAVGRSIPTRGDETSAGLPPVIMPRNRPTVIAAMSIAGVLALVLTSGGYRFGVITSLAVALIALSLVVLTGLVGQISLAQAAFGGIAGIVLYRIGDSIPFPLSLLLAALFATAAGIVVGLPALRIRGAQLAVVTLAAALSLEKFVFANPSIVSATANRIPDPTLFGIDLAVRRGTDVARLPFGIMVLVVVVIAFVLVGNIMRSGTGRKMLAVRSNERAAASIGIGVASIKLTAFALASFLAGLGGALIGYSRGQLSPESFGVFVGLSFLAITYLGGITSLSGAIVAGAMAALGIVFVFFDRVLSLGSYYALFSGVSLILTVILNPVGIAGKTRADFDAYLARRAGSRRVDVIVDDTGDVFAEAAGAAAAPERPALGPVVLRARGVTVQYGGLRAVDEVVIDIRAGEIVGLIGPNGAGKTSFIDAITGFTPYAGSVELDGATLDGMAPHRRVREGLVRTWQSVELFHDLSVLHNVQVSTDVGGDVGKLLRDAVRPSRPPTPAVMAAMARMGLNDVGERKPAELSLGRQKLVGVARSLAHEPRVLLLDEPAAGLDMTESAAFGQLLREIAASGVACLLVDHDMHLMMGVCDRIYAIDFGKPIADGTPEQVRSDPSVISAYLGASHTATHPTASSAVPTNAGGER
jgi:ABC-type branched-subunit amino acid transport system ATPase component/branched-subunit amino acid ABC-type transport system permease component